MPPNGGDHGHYNPHEWKKPKWQSSRRTPQGNSPRSPLQDLSPRELARMNSHSSCCRTRVHISEGEQFPVGNTTTDSLTPEFKPCHKYIATGTGAWSEKWKATKRYIDPGLGEEKAWRPSVKTFEPRLGFETDYKPRIKPDKASTGLETNEANFRPGRRRLVPVTALKREQPYTRKKHVQVVSEWIPPFRVAGEDYNTAPPKRDRTRATVPGYYEKHPPMSLAWETPSLPGRPNTATSRPGSANITPYAFGIVPTEGARPMKKYIPEGHLSHFEGNVCCVCKPGTTEKKILKGRRATGPYHETANERNLISGLLAPTDVHRPMKISRGPQLYAPAGTLNADIIDHCFSDFKRVGTPVSEMRDQYRIPDLSKENAN